MTSYITIAFECIHKGAFGAVSLKGFFLHSKYSFRFCRPLRFSNSPFENILWLLGSRACCKTFLGSSSIQRAQKKSPPFVFLFSFFFSFGFLFFFFFATTGTCRKETLPDDSSTALQKKLPASVLAPQTPPPPNVMLACLFACVLVH